MFQGLWPGFDVDEVPIGSITNGVHAPTWVGREVIELAGSELPALVERAQGWEGVQKISDAEIWGIRGTLRAPPGRGGPGAAARSPGGERGASDRRAQLDRRRRSTPTCSPSGSPAACPPTSGSR